MIRKHLTCSGGDSISKELRLPIDSHQDITWLTTSKTSVICLLDYSLRLLLAIGDCAVIFNNGRLSKANESCIHLACSMYLWLCRGFTACVYCIRVLLTIASIYSRG